MESSLEDDAKSIEKILNGKCVSKIMYPKQNDVCIEFTDGTRLFVTAPNNSKLDFSITGGTDE